MTSTSEPTGFIDWSAYSLPDETRELVATARAHFTRVAKPEALRLIFDGGQRPDLWQTLVEHGYTSVGVPEEVGGIGTRVDLAALLETAGETLLPAPLTTHAAATHILLAAESPRAVSIESRMALATDLGDGRALVFDGVGAEAIVLVTAAADGARVRVFAIPEGAGEVQRAVDPSRANIIVEVEDLSSADDRTVVAGRDECFAGARMCLAADLVGTAQRALDGTIAHALTRRQFDRIIGSFQALKHLIADAHVNVERARSLVIGAAVALDADPLSREGATLSMLAKAAAAEAAEDTAALHVQVLGAMGLTFEADSPWEVRRARHTTPVLGTPSALYARAARRRLSDQGHVEGSAP